MAVKSTNRKNKATKSKANTKTKKQPIHKPTDTGPDLLAALAEDATSVEPDKKSKESLVFDLEGEEAEHFRTHVQAAKLEELAKSLKEQESNLIIETLYGRYLNSCYSNEAVLDSPKVTVSDNQGNVDCISNMIVKPNAATPKFPKVTKNLPTLREAVVNTLTKGKGCLSKEQAETFFDNEVVEKEETTFKPFDKLLSGEKEEQAAVKKVLTFILKECTPEERGLLLEKKKIVSFKSSMLARALSYVENEEEFTKLLSVVKISHYFSHREDGVSYSLEERKNRLLDAAELMIAAIEEEEED